MVAVIGALARGREVEGEDCRPFPKCVVVSESVSLAKNGSARARKKTWGIVDPSQVLRRGRLMTVVLGGTAV